jgi:hypothetical protein
VSGNVTGGNVLTGGLISATGAIIGANVTGANLLTAGLISATGNITGGNLSGTSIVGTLTTAAQTNITSVGTLDSLAVTGNITGGNILGGANVNATTHTGTTVSVTGNITGGNVLGGANVNATTHTGATVSVTANVTGGNLITAGAIVSCISFSASGNITGGNVIVGNLVFSTDTISSQDGTITIDPAAVGVTGLVIIQGNLQVNGNTTTINSNVVSTNDLTYNLANNAINSAAANGGGIEVGPIGSPYITWLYNSTAGSWETDQGISATGNITGSYFLGNGSQLTGIDATSIQNGTSNVRVVSSGGNVSVSVGGTSNVAVYAITGEYVTGLISATGNITGGNLSVGTGTLSGGNIVNTNANGVGNIG